MNVDPEIESLLNPGRAPALRDRAGFVDRVMQRVALEERPALPVALWSASPIPWWIQAATDPASILACTLLALLWWRPTWLTELNGLLSDRWSLLGWPAVAQARATLGLDRPGIALGLEVLGLLALGWASLHLYRWIERVTRRSAGA
jgi:hypothetical protein